MKAAISFALLLALLPFKAAAYTFVFQCNLIMGGAIVTDNTPQHVRFEITYEFGQPNGWLVGAPGEVEIMLNEIDEFVVVTSLEEIPNMGSMHTVRIHKSGSANYVFLTKRNDAVVTYQWQGTCENMRPL